MSELEHQETIELIAGYFTGQLDDQQLVLLNDWIGSGKENKLFFNQMRELWFAAPLSFPRKSFDKESAYQLFLSRKAQRKPEQRSSKKQPSAYSWITRVAAALIVGFMLGAFFVYKPSEAVKSATHQETFTETIVPLGSRSRVVLADGTKVWLNAGSKLRHATNFGQTTREVFLEGEGYFDVARDTAKTFIVKTDKVSIKALGTSFNVKAYPGEANIEAVLVEGKISIDDKLVITPNEKFIYSRKNEKLIIEKKISEEKKIETVPVQTQQIADIVETQIDPAIYTSWKDELWRIESETLSSLVIKLERRYDVQIRFADRGIQTLSINAAIKDESLEQVLRFLQLSIPIDFKIKGKSVVLSEDKYLKERYKEYYKQK